MPSSSRALLVALSTLTAACSSGSSGDSDGSKGVGESQQHAHTRSSLRACEGDGCPQSKIEHLVVVIQENHSFDTYFGRYCTAPPGSNPTCTDGPACCEAGPALDPAGNAPRTLDDASNQAYDPRHDRECEAAEIHGGRMDRFSSLNVSVSGELCGDRGNFAYASETVVWPYHELAWDGALADRYFQPIIGASSANDMYLARAGYVFDNNSAMPSAVGTKCSGASESRITAFDDETIGDLLTGAHVPWLVYAEGYQRMLLGEAVGTCPAAPADCPSDTSAYPCGYDPSDIPFAYYASTGDASGHLVDFAAFGQHLAGGGLPAVSFVKALGYHSEHPGSTISAGAHFVKELADDVARSRYADTTLILVTWDESGGYFDHVAPPADNAFDRQPYGPRVPLLAIGPFARKSTVSHAVLEHSSIVRFIEWNWLGGATGQLQTRDAQVSNLGSLLDPEQTGAIVPER